MDLGDYYRLLRRQWITVTVATLVGLMGAAIFTLAVSPTYTARTQLFVSIQNSGSVQELAQGNTFGQSRVQSYVRTATTPTVLQPVVDSLGLETTAIDLASQIEVTADLNTVLINVDVTDNSPIQAAAIAQGVAESLVQAVDSLERPSASDPSPVKLSVVTPAVAPAEPSTPNAVLNLGLGLTFGLMAGLAIALFRSTMDTKIRGEADVRRRTDAAILGGISLDSNAAKKPLLTQAAHQSPRAESFRQIRTNIQFAQVDRRSNTVLVTSSLPGEGKSTTATNLALALAETGQTVALVDADLRRPMISTYLGLERNAGLTTALVGKADIEDLLQPWGTGSLSVLTSGAIPPNPSELLGSAAMQQVIKHLENNFDAVIIDAPPLLPVTDATVLAQSVGGVILVVANQQISTKDLDKSLASLSLVKADLLGIVLNKMPAKGPDAYSYTYYTQLDDETSESKQQAGPAENRSRRRVKQEGALSATRSRKN